MMISVNYKFGWFGTLVQIITHYTLKVYYETKYDMYVENREAIPKGKHNYIVISNHLSVKDIALMTYTFGYRITFLAKEELFRNFFARMYFRAANIIPVNRGKPQASTMKLAKKALNSPGWRMCIFIEGTRSRIPGQLGKPFVGPMVIAKMTGKPVIPMGISYIKQEGKKTKAIVKIGEMYEVDKNLSLMEQAWDGLERISKLCDQGMPERD